MARIEYEIEIKATRDAVFSRIEKVEDFKNYSSAITEIKKIGENLYQWRITIFGVPFWWHSEVVERRRPERFSWRSVKGVANRGSYTLEERDSSTVVHFEMEYSSGGSFLEKVLEPFASFVISRIYREVLENIKKAAG
jgi:uncharacterized membrane protein